MAKPRIADLEQIELKDRRIAELREENDDNRDLISRMREHIENDNAYLENFITAWCLNNEKLSEPPQITPLDATETARDSAARKAKRAKPQNRIHRLSFFCFPKKRAPPPPTGYIQLRQLRLN